jgi:hypothetical protein
VGAGVSFQHLSGLREIGDQFSRSITGRSANGFVVAGGLEGHFLFLRFSPEIRFTHRPNEALVNTPTDRPVLGTSQIDFLVGIAF